MKSLASTEGVNKEIPGFAMYQSVKIDTNKGSKIMQNASNARVHERVIFGALLTKRIKADRERRRRERLKFWQFWTRK